MKRKCGENRQSPKNESRSDEHLAAGFNPADERCGDFDGVPEVRIWPMVPTAPLRMDAKAGLKPL
ncbi:MAG: hypothetical protein IPO07_29740 [Haliscomenobacter sp.]|nr:hypothetical protein [Haliscomenobacter sp.]MBK9492509.1 hypothetical protein [Haliscomenobacter sp.]